MLRVQILSPENTIFEGEVKSIKLPGVQGEFHVFDLHAGLIALLGKGSLKLDTTAVIDAAHKEDHFTCIEISSGVVEVKNNVLVILVD